MSEILHTPTPPQKGLKFPGERRGSHRQTLLKVVNDINDNWVVVLEKIPLWGREDMDIFWNYILN